jgi:ammonium transporter Rh
MSTRTVCLCALILSATLPCLAQMVSASEMPAGETAIISQTAGESAAGQLASLVEVQKYNRSIHIMAMLMVGFGFLMVFVKKYGRSAVTATYLLVSMAIPVYFFMRGHAPFDKPEVIEMDRMIMAEFAAASLLICAGAVLGRLKMSQYLVLAVIFTLCYMANEWIVLNGGLGMLAAGAVKDTGGSIVIHAFGALFGLGVILTMTTQKEFAEKIECDATSDRFSMLGSMVLWIFWPSFCAALVAPEMVAFTAINVVLALCGATVVTYIASVVLREGKISIADVANASLAGGVAIGSTCDTADHQTALLIGMLAGAVSTFGFAIIQNRLQSAIKSIDTCGVLNLHGTPGLLGGVAAIFVITGIDKVSQLKGIGITIAVALLAGYITGKILSAFGRKAAVYVDADEFEGAEEPHFGPAPAAKASK